jgi:hypothetical protein
VRRIVHLEAVDRLIAAVQPSEEAAPLVEAARGLAALLDLDGSDPAVWREYRFMLRDLREAVGGDSGADLEEEFARLDS